VATRMLTTNAAISEIPEEKEGKRKAAHSPY